MCGGGSGRLAFFILTWRHCCNSISLDMMMGWQAGRYAVEGGEVVLLLPFNEDGPSHFLECFARSRQLV